MSLATPRCDDTNDKLHLDIRVSPGNNLEPPRLGCRRDTRLFSLVRSSQRALSSRIDGAHRLDLSLGLFVALPLLDTRISVGLGSSRGKTSVLLDGPGERTRSIARLGFGKRAPVGRVSSSQSASVPAPNGWHFLKTHLCSSLAWSCACCLASFSSVRRRLTVS